MTMNRTQRMSDGSDESKFATSTFGLLIAGWSHGSANHEWREREPNRQCGCQRIPAVGRNCCLPSKSKCPRHGRRLKHCLYGTSIGTDHLREGQRRRVHACSRLHYPAQFVAPGILLLRDAGLLASLTSRSKRPGCTFRSGSDGGGPRDNITIGARGNLVGP